MKRDQMKTAAGVLIIAAIVVATFLYGNQQRQKQIRQDHSKQQAAGPSAPAGSDKTATGSSTPTTPASGTTPAAGPGLGLVLPLTVVAVAYQAMKSSRRRLANSLRHSALQ